MRRALVTAAALLLLVLLLGSCQKPDVRLTVLIGATTIPAQGARPIDDSVIVIAAKRIRSVGERKDVPIPQNSDRVDFTGRWVVPAAGSRIAPGEPANLLVLSHEPNGVSPASAADITSRMVAGEWSR